MTVDEVSNADLLQVTVGLGDDQVTHGCPPNHDTPERLMLIVALAREVTDSAAASGRCVTRPIDEQSHTGNCQYLLLLAPRSNVDCPVGGTVRSPRPVAVAEPDAGFGIHQRRIRHPAWQGGLA
jgi:hypothetical protein